MQKKNEIWNVFASVFAIKHEFYQFHPFSLWSLGGKKKSPEKTTNFIGFLETCPKILIGCFYPKIRHFDGDFLDFGKKGVFSCYKEVP